MHHTLNIPLSKKNTVTSYLSTNNNYNNKYYVK